MRDNSKHWIEQIPEKQIMVMAKNTQDEPGDLGVR